MSGMIIISFQDLNSGINIGLRDAGGLVNHYAVEVFQRLCTYISVPDIAGKQSNALADGLFILSLVLNMFGSTKGFLPVATHLFFELLVR